MKRGGEYDKYFKYNKPILTFKMLLVNIIPHITSLKMPMGETLELKC